MQKTYPEQPIKPLDSDCCGSGCLTCVFDLYDLEVSRWQKKCEELDNNIDVIDDTDILNIYEYKEFKITDVNHISESIKIFTFHIANNQILPLKCGQHLIARCFTESNECIIRPYTPVSRCDHRGSFLIAVKLYPTGKMSKCMSNWDIGTSVEWRGPFGDKLYVPNEYTSLLLLAGGTGITPMIQLLHEILNNENDLTRVYVVYSVKTSDDIIMVDQLREWNGFWNCTIRFCLTGSNAEDEKMKYGDLYYLQRIDEGIINHMTDKQKNTKVIICGSKLFNQDMSELATEMFHTGNATIACIS